jgi:hypothetical protein
VCVQHNVHSTHSWYTGGTQSSMTHTTRHLVPIARCEQNTIQRCSAVHHTRIGPVCVCVCVCVHGGTHAASNAWQGCQISAAHASVLTSERDGVLASEREGDHGIPASFLSRPRLLLASVVTRPPAVIEFIQITWKSDSAHKMTVV